MPSLKQIAKAMFKQHNPHLFTFTQQRTAANGSMVTRQIH